MFNTAIGELTCLASIAEEESLLEIEFPDKKEYLINHAKSLKEAAKFLEVAQLGGLTALVSAVRQWGVDKGITGPMGKATPMSQFHKLIEEVEEVRVGLLKNDQHEVVDGIGDCTVVLILLSELVGVKFETCLLAAYEEIKNRKGKMIDGQFYKES